MPWVMLGLALDLLGCPERGIGYRVVIAFYIFCSRFYAIGYMNALRRFAAAAAAPILFNFVLIGSIRFSDYLDIRSCIAGVFLAGVMQFFWCLEL